METYLENRCGNFQGYVSTWVVDQAWRLIYRLAT